MGADSNNFSSIGFGLSSSEKMTTILGRRPNVLNDIITVSGIESDEVSMTPKSQHDSISIPNGQVDELGVINEESMSQNTSQCNPRPKKKKSEILYSKTHEFKNGEFPILLMPNPKVPKNGSKRKLDLMRYKTKMDEDMDMIEIMTDLDQLSTSKKALKKIDEEMSKYTEESKESLGSRNTKIQKSLKNVIKKASMRSIKPLPNDNHSKHIDFSEDQYSAKSISQSR